MEGTTEQRGIVLAHQALEDTLGHIHAFTHWPGRAQKRVLLPTATQSCAGISEDSPLSQSSPGVPKPISTSLLQST